MRPTDELPVIFADRVQSLNYDGPDGSEVFADAGTSIELVTGNITSTGLVVNGTTGDVAIRGEVTATAFALLDGTALVGELTTTPNSANGYNFQTGLDCFGTAPPAAFNQLAWATETFGTATVSRVGIASLTASFGKPTSSATWIAYNDSSSPGNDRAEFVLASSQEDGNNRRSDFAVRSYSTFVEVSSYVAYGGVTANLRLIAQSSGADLRSDARLGGAWTNITLSGSWSNYGAGYGFARYRKFGDVVTLTGLVRCAPGGVPSLVGVLPAGFRPASNQQRIFVCRGNTSVNGDVVMRVDVDPSGQILLRGAGGYTGNVGYLSLDGISFSVT